ncbi:endonuclease/exonuclease/phosphatase family protein [Phycicoccus duodecadis]|uniref:Endonuclease/exonuclease/phosphatase family metal-dependent hydrolase n=1 Tax=Phycicoccus duodecadis TaxID=173053 RepID=A0A2N3YFG5_9MICO|nr:endonuclease/exonuclease/phosphatase family protein [Phycicoccus duodecadis]PKW25591.1 endonuclease/exonuclease/phosphatase family metal-dependent hydrolase [Phycicoccus duodecadis]
MTGAGVLRVASYNTRDFLDDHRLAARVVRAVDPDVLCLQEVPRRLLAGARVRRFAAACGMDWTGRHRGSGGTTVLTSPRVRVLGGGHHRLPVRWPDRTRGFAEVRVLPPGGAPVSVVSVHLGLKAGERVAHTERILAALADREPLVLAGDLNEDDTGAAWRLIDVPGRLRLVSPPEPTFPARAPRRRLDVVFASPGLRVRPHREVAVPDAVWARASDHRAVWVDLEAPAR